MPKGGASPLTRRKTRAIRAFAGKGRASGPGRAPRPCFRACARRRSRDQLRARSTILPLAIQGIMPRSFSPTCSI